eukprot:TRINITY_DN30272_c0_g1_i1.p1 TRINITY_DN30272_c0_g1~~TRINITY_DN30272_c0_g1_i1.p1  ORF type:complete len:162 (+),score=41.58 TRINITY_DN30272_c0_g1_i1:63-488(+)
MKAVIAVQLAMLVCMCLGEDTSDAGIAETAHHKGKHRGGHTGYWKNHKYGGRRHGSTDDDDDDDSKSLKVALCISAAVLVVVLCVVACCLMNRRNNEKKAAAAADKNSPVNGVPANAIETLPEGKEEELFDVKKMENVENV